MKSLEHILTEAILDYEDELLTMEHRERERYEPMARQRARFLADRLRSLGVVQPGDIYFGGPVDNNEA